MTDGHTHRPTSLFFNPQVLKKIVSQSLCCGTAPGCCRYSSTSPIIRRISIVWQLLLSILGQRVVSILISHNVHGTPSCASLRAVSIPTGPAPTMRGPGGNIVSSGLMEPILGVIGVGQRKYVYCIQNYYK